jgi:hypothetical protein
MNKKGFLRIVEATISIILIMGVLFVFFNQTQAIKEPDYSEKARNILEEISRDSSLRNEILLYDTDIGGPIPINVDDFVDQKIFENFLEYEVRICEVDTACGKSEYTPGNVFSAERSISSTLDSLGPIKIRLFIWEIG